MKSLVLVLGLVFTNHLAWGGDFSLQSSALQAGKSIEMENVFDGFGCTGANVSPALEWKGAPEGTKSFAITVYDPDAPTGSGWWHWVVFNIPAGIHKIPTGAGKLASKKMPAKAIQSRTDFGTLGYGGPCPPPGDKPHRYFFKVFALKDQLPLKADTPAAQVGYYIQQHKLAEAEIMATFKR